MPNRLRSAEDLYAVLDGAVPELAAVIEAAGGAPLFVVGGTVRDLLLGRGRTDLDVAVEGDAAAVAHRLGGEVSEHGRFATAQVVLAGAKLDLASTRAETYPAAGSLPEVRPAGIEEDLGRRDFTVNAMALPLQGSRALIDPHGGRADLEVGALRVLHDASFRDDPTRALRAARYAARFGFVLEAGTEELLRATDLNTVSADRRDAELRRVAREPAAPDALGLLAGWGLLDVRPEHLDLCRRCAELLAAPPWSAVAPRDRTLLAAARGPGARARELAGATPGSPSEGAEMARGADPEDLVLARAMGGAWLDRYVTEWRSVVLEVRGTDLMAAGIPEGPAVGEGLAAALRAKLDGETAGREDELRIAIEAARAGA
jgi:tRNA nucleotidyltransferase (CCA-adding enzyme)